MNTLESNSLEYICDRQEIADLLARYCRGVDRLDWALVRSCYHDDALDDHGGFKGDPDGFVAMLARALPRFSLTRHVITNSLVQIQGHVASGETYCDALHRLTRDDGTVVDERFGVRYIDRFEKRQGTWKILSRLVVFDWNRVDPVAETRPLGPGAVAFSRDEEDASYAVLAG
jgi:hypothetical protein